MNRPVYMLFGAAMGKNKTITYEYENSVKVIVGKNSLDVLPAELARLNVNTIMLLSGPIINKLGLVNRVRKKLEAGGAKVRVVFIDIPIDSGVAVVNKISDLCLLNRCDGIVALGGGSIIDTAKAVKLTFNEKITIDAFSGGVDGVRRLNANIMPLICIPTTSGSGSEVSRATVIYDEKRKRKIEIITSEVLPEVAILDPSTVVTLSPRATFIFAIDLLSHAIEAYVSKEKNPVSDSFAEVAIQYFNATLDSVLLEPNNLALREAMMIATNYAGLAFSNSMVGVAHALAHAIGAYAHVPHANCCLIVLVEAMRYNQICSDKYLAELLKLTISHEEYCGVPEENRGTAFINWVDGLLEKYCQQFEISRKLRDYGVVESDFDKISRIALRDGAIITNPRQVILNEAMEILGKIY